MFTYGIRDVLALFVVSHRKRKSWQQAVASTVIIVVVGLVDVVPITRNTVELPRLCEDGMPAMREIS